MSARRPRLSVSSACSSTALTRCALASSDIKPIARRGSGSNWSNTPSTMLVRWRSTVYLLTTTAGIVLSVPRLLVTPRDSAPPAIRSTPEFAGLCPASSHSCQNVSNSRYSVMKRLHVHVSVEDLAKSIQFYSTLFAAEPTRDKDDYAKWMLEDPRVNFAISQRDSEAGIRHLGIQVEDRAELADVYARLQRAESPMLEEGATDLLLREE